MPMQTQRRRAAGFSLIELMIALTLGLVILASLTTFFVSTSQGRRELERNSRQLENGRFAVDSLRSAIHLAGYYGDLAQGAATWKEPDPCAKIIADLGFKASPVEMPVPFFGISGDAATPACTPDRVANTDILVVRRLNTEPVVPTAIPAEDQVLPFLQSSRCQTDSSTEPFVFGAGSGGVGTFKLKRVTCGTSINTVQRYRVELYYIRECSDCGNDKIPTLWKVELAANAGVLAMVQNPIVEGIRDLRFEYGIDNDTDGTPDEFKRCSAAAPCTTAQWANVTTVRMHILSENLEESQGYVDKKEYNLADVVVGPFGDGFKRQVYTTLATAYNRTGPRE